MESCSVKNEMVVGNSDLIDLVFSWSIADVINTDLYKEQVKTIPYIFSSATEYLNSFITPLIEETRADLLTGFKELSDAPYSEIKSVKRSKDFKLPKALLYKIELQRGVENENDMNAFEPEVGDLIAVTSVRPTCVDDLDRPERSYLIGHVRRVKERDDHFKLLMLSSKPSLVEDHMEGSGKRTMLFAVKLINMTTNIRIMTALNCDQKAVNMNIIQNVLQAEFNDVENCTICQSDRSCSATNSDVRARIHKSDLNDSQQNAILSCIRATECYHQNTVKMIWGPPGTGKTKTVGFLLSLLLRLECRTLTCTPTNTAVLQVTNQLVKYVMDSANYRMYGLGDIVLVGNRKRMKIDDHDELYSVFLDYRAEILAKCFDPSFGWKDTLLDIISLLKEPDKQYRTYLRKMNGEDEDLRKNDNTNVIKEYVNLENKDFERNTEKDDSDKSFEVKKGKKDMKHFILQFLKENKTNKRPKDLLHLLKENKSEQEGRNRNDVPGKKKEREEKKVRDIPLTFGEFVKKRFDFVGEWLYFLIVNLYTHLPTSVISSEVVKNMLAAIRYLKQFQQFLHGVADEDLKEAFSRGSQFTNLNGAKVSSIFTLESLPSKFSFPYTCDKRVIREYCLKKACLIFCTTSGSAKLNIIDMKPLELLVIDEVAQLKECESTIPLQLHGFRHAILVGDEQQLPAMVKSQISEEADFGRSLFERLAYLGHKKHLLNIQYRMHPSISLFPNREFYNNQILNGPNVKDRIYNRSFFKRKMYGSYSFINVSHGKEEFNEKRSRKNIVEVAVVLEMVESLHKEFILTKKKFRVGVITPYKAQVHALTEKIRKYIIDAHNGFLVSVCTVDGFQGGEDDIIIISTVRCNGIGSLSFLSSRQRANVALTRARYCLWIVGSGETLRNSGTFWKNLVIDAEERGCFHDAWEDKNMARAITVALIGLNQISMLLGLDAVLFRKARWKVCFTYAFWKSMTSVKNNLFCKKVLNLLENLSSGWRKADIRRDRDDEISSQLVEYYLVNMELYLVWTVDILQEDSHCIQILQVWDILPLSKIPELSKQIVFLHRSYSVDKLSRCKYECYEGDLLVPMTWPVKSSCAETNPGKLLPKSMPLFLKDESETSSVNKRNLVALVRQEVDSSCGEADPGQLSSQFVASFSSKHDQKTPLPTNTDMVVPLKCSVGSSCNEDDPMELEPEILERVDRNFVVPKSWPVDSSCNGADPIESLSKLMALLSLRDDLSCCEMTLN
ncbi:uncharacterized protein LOC133822555 [Humulus lupulus]|uniref:uncharacterized protein LOC133822555 n=1 Tax=Humulus lupulus TaxID=3486 RepID=UPI002B4181D4|nr:uncharacterized protein LOC133822555 [Humulus lupulus]